MGDEVTLNAAGTADIDLELLGHRGMETEVSTGDGNTLVIQCPPGTEPPPLLMGQAKEWTPTETPGESNLG